MKFWLLCTLVVSTLLHMPARLPFLGAIRFDLLVGMLALALCFFGAQEKDHRNSYEKEATSRLWHLVIYVIVTLPLVRWPGSVLNTGFETFFKAIVFYFLIVKAIHTERQLGIFLSLFGVAQVFRVLEPLYLHVAYGYWGSATNMGNWEMMDRLSGAPSDIINPNGLGYVIVSTLPLLFFFQRGSGWAMKAVVWMTMGAMLYALMLTGSRSAFLVLVLLIGAWVWSSQRKVLAIGVLVSVCAVLLANMSELQQERYLSIFRSDVGGAATAQGRIDGVFADFKTALERPLFGHGLGTSWEVNANVGGGAQISHNLYAETSQELGFLGLLVFLRFVAAALRGGYAASLVGRRSNLSRPIAVAASAMVVLMVTNLVFSFASYGLSEFHWYFLAGLGVVTVRLVQPAQGGSTVLAERTKTTAEPAAGAPFSNPYTGL